MKKNNQRKIGVMLSYITVIINSLIQLLYTPFLIRMLGPREHGLYSLVSSIIGYLTVLDLGFGNALIVYTAKYHEQQKYDEETKLNGMFFVVFGIIGLVAGILGIILYFNVDHIFGKTMTDLEIYKTKIMMLILTFNLVFTFLFSIYSAIINAYEKFVFQKVLSILNSILRPILMIPLLFLGYKSIAMTIVITLINVGIVISNYLYCKKKLKVSIHFSGFDKKLLKEICGYSFFIFLAVIVDKINWSVDQVILGAVSGTIAVSLYSVASQLNTLFVNLSTAVSNILLPKMSKMVANHVSDHKLTEEFIRVGRIQTFIIIFMIGGLILFGKQFIILWAGEKYEISYYIALLLIIPLSVPLIQNLGISIMQAKNLHKFRGILYVFIALFNVVISIPLAKLYGGIGSAIGTSVSLIIGNIIMINIYYHKRVGINIIQFWKVILKLMIPLILFILLSLLMIPFWSNPRWLTLFVGGSIYTIIYSFIAYFICMNQYEKNLILNIVSKLKKR